MNLYKKILGWYFTKNALPYWCLFLIDLGIVMVSALFTFWIFNRTGVLFEERFDVLYTALAYTLLSAVGAKLFSTYSGVVRYSSFVDLMRVAYANALSLILALILSWVAEDYGVRELSALNQTQTFVTFILAVIVMWGVRVMVKTLYDVTASDKRAMRVLIYGARIRGLLRWHTYVPSIY